MTFAEKLNFLMKLTDTTNKRLGDCLGVHQSQVSRLRSGSRGQPGNGEYIRLMSEHFASACTMDYQRAALADALGRPVIRFHMDSSVLSVIISEWLIGAIVDSMAKQDRMLPTPRDLTLSSSEPADRPQTINPPFLPEMSAFFGDQGKRMAVQAFLEFIRRTGEPLRLSISSDESLGWLVSDAAFAREVQRYFSLFMEQGCTCRRIVGPAANLDYSYASLTMRWLPSYISGNTVPYYFPRLRDDVYHMTILTASGRAAVFSSSMGRSSGEQVTFFTTNRQVVMSLEAQFEAYRALCVPYMTKRVLHQSHESFFNCFTEFEGIQSPCILRSGSLSDITMPEELLRTLRSEDRAVTEAFTASMLRRQELFSCLLDEYQVTDIISLAEPDSVSASKVPIDAALTFEGKPRFYTVRTYLSHLRSILRLAQTRPNYRPVIRQRDGGGLHTVYVKEGRRVLLLRDDNRVTVFEISERNLVAAFSELLRRSMDPAPDEAEQRTRDILRIQELISKLEALR